MISRSAMTCAKEMLKHLYITLLFLVINEGLILIAHSQDQSGFISLDCGLPDNFTYTEPTTKLTYVSDAAFVIGGKSNKVSQEYHHDSIEKQKKTLRSFPEGTRNCYTTHARKEILYLIRATFFYGNYDAENSPPKFDLHVGPNFWDTVEFVDSATPVVKEAIHNTSRNHLRVCLVNTGFGAPFMSALEIRPIENITYQYYQPELLRLIVRYDVGSTTNESYRYPYDIFDRLWSLYYDPEWRGLSTSETVQTDSDLYKFRPPNIVMQTAVTPENESAPLQFKFASKDVNTNFYVFLHCAEIQRLKPNESRYFSISVNGQRRHDPYSPGYLSSEALWFSEALTGELSYVLTMDRLEGSTLPPILNGLEIFDLVYMNLQETDENDVKAIGKVKSYYRVKKNWNGDPCHPVSYLWRGLNCTVDADSVPRITYLDLSSSALTGEISPSIGDLNMLESLDLSNNDLTGPVPQFLAQLPNLRVLNLNKNKLSGVVPAELIHKSKNGSLSLSFEENQDLCSSSPCK